MMCKMLRILRRGWVGLALCLLLLFAWPSANAATLGLTAPDSLRPYAKAQVQVDIPQAGLLSLFAHIGDEQMPMMLGKQVKAGQLSLEIDGLSAIGEMLPRGQAKLRAELTNEHGSLQAEAAIQIQAPAAGLAYALLSSLALPATGGEDLYVDYQLSRAGMLQVRLFAAKDLGSPIGRWNIQREDALPHAFRWDRRIQGKPAPAGDYVLSFAVNGSQQEAILLPFTLTEDAWQPAPLAVNTPGSFLPDSRDEAAVWAALMAPIAIVEIGDLAHQAVYEQPSTKSAKLGLVHGQTAGMQILALDMGGFAQVRAARHGDGEWIIGYVPQNKLRMIRPDPRYGLLIDKDSQTLTVYAAGRAMGSLAVSTGIYVPPGTRSFDTVPGAFLTQDRIAEFASEGHRFAYATRIDGGNLIHSAGYRLQSGQRDYGLHQASLGSPASLGCVRVDNRLSAEGLNAWWLYANLPRNTKVLVMGSNPLPEGIEGEIGEALVDGASEMAMDYVADSAKDEPVQAEEESVLPLAQTTQETAQDETFLRPDSSQEPAFQVVEEEAFDVDHTTPDPAKTSQTAPGHEPLATEQMQPGRTRITLSFGGDCILGSEEHKRRDPASFHSKIEEQGYAWPFLGLAELFHQDDLSMINLENVLKNSAEGLESRLHNFRGPTAYTQILQLGGIDLVNIANNHFVDYGQDGRNSTRRALREAGIPYAGYSSLYVFEKEGIRIGFGGIRETIFHQNRQRIADEIKELQAQGAQYIVYTCHFGIEYEPRHNELQTLMARMAIDAGANLVIGHHPHVVQGIEEYEQGLIFYSLGNLVFGGNLDLSTFDGLVAQVHLDFEGQQLQQTQVRLVPVITSGSRPDNDFQPQIATGEDKARILATIAADSEQAYPETFILGKAD